jgi:hypothetical protein
MASTVDQGGEGVQDGSHMAHTQLSYVALRCVACLGFVHAAQEPRAQQPDRKAHYLPSTMNTRCYEPLMPHEPARLPMGCSGKC